MKFDVNVMRHLGRDDFRTLQAVEIGQKNVSGGKERERERKRGTESFFS